MISVWIFTSDFWNGSFSYPEWKRVGRCSSSFVVRNMSSSPFLRTVDTEPLIEDVWVVFEVPRPFFLHVTPLVGSRSVFMVVKTKNRLIPSIRTFNKCGFYTYRVFSYNWKKPLKKKGGTIKTKRTIKNK